MLEIGIYDVPYTIITLWIGINHEKIVMMITDSELPNAMYDIFDSLTTQDYKSVLNAVLDYLLISESTEEFETTAKNLMALLNF